jgi:hypothetical protein
MLEKQSIKRLSIIEISFENLFNILPLEFLSKNSYGDYFIVFIILLCIYSLDLRVHVQIRIYLYHIIINNRNIIILKIKKYLFYS